MLMVGAIASRLPLAATFDNVMGFKEASGASLKNADETIKGTFACKAALSSTTPGTVNEETYVSFSGTCVDFSLVQDIHKTDITSNHSKPCGPVTFFINVCWFSK